MALWVDKHRPKTLDALDFHKDVSERLKGMVKRGDFPHLLVYGPSGAGKKTRILALLREAFGSAVEKVSPHSIRCSCSHRPISLKLNIAPGRSLSSII